MAQTIGQIALSLILLVGLAPLAEGLLRKLKATIHSRQGPPVIQPYLDLAKLSVKEDLAPTTGWVWRMVPALCLGATMVVAMLTPIGGPPPHAEKMVTATRHRKIIRSMGITLPSSGT